MLICTTKSFSTQQQKIEENLQHYFKDYALLSTNTIKFVNFETKQFADGEFLPIFHESVRDEEVVIIGSTHQPHDNIFELLLIIDAARRSSAKKITCIIPFFGYARQDRRGGLRCSHGSKLVANLLENAGANQIITYDIHAQQIDGNFNIPFYNYTINNIFHSAFTEKFNSTDYILCSPDSGGIKRLEQINNDFNNEYEMVTIYKKRTKANIVDSMQLIGDVKDKNVVIVDDILDTGGTLCKAVDLLLEHGAKTVHAVITHPVCSKNCAENISKSKLTSLFISDTIPTDKILKANKLSLDRNELPVDIYISSLSKTLSTILINLYNSNSINTKSLF
jgi:ribose-phosphate pyrophosphokinase